MTWSPDRHALRGRVAVVTGGGDARRRPRHRGTLGEAGATVVCTGRSTGSVRSDYDRPETIEETAELVTRLGGTGISVAVDHLDPAQVKALADRLRKDHGHIDVLVNDIWGGELLKGGPAQWNNASRYRISVFYDLAKMSVNRLAFSQGHDLAPHGATAVAITPGWLRSEMMLDNFGVSEENWRAAVDRATAPADFALSESPRYVGRAVVALASDPGRARWNQQSVSSAQIAHAYGFTDLDGSRPDIWRYFEEVRETGRQTDLGDYR